jgi:hypothetical protein
MKDTLSRCVSGPAHRSIVSGSGVPSAQATTTEVLGGATGPQAVQGAGEHAEEGPQDSGDQPALDGAEDPAVAGEADDDAPCQTEQPPV